MTQNEKVLLMKDLCSRLPYGVKVKFKVNEVIAIEEKFIYNVDGEYSYITDGKSYLTLDIIKALFNNYLDEIKPYLFPMSSMNEEQRKEFIQCAGYECREEENGCHYERYYYDMVGHGDNMFPDADGIDWLNKNHFDYRGLIEKGLAIDCSNLNIY